MYKERIEIAVRAHDEVTYNELDGLITIEFDATEINHPKFNQSIEDAVKELGLPENEAQSLHDQVVHFIDRKMKVKALEDRLV